MLRMTGQAPTPAVLPSKTFEPCPVKPNQTQDPSSGMEEERCLEQVQTMVVGEVLKDVDTACKLLNIASGKITFTFDIHISLIARKELFDIRN